MTDQPTTDEGTAVTTIEVVDPEEQALVSEYEARASTHAEEPFDKWLPDWFLGKLAAFDGVEKAIAAQVVLLKAEVATARRALVRRWGPMFREVVCGVLAKSTKKSVNFHTGKAGYRKTPGRAVVTEPLAAMEWAQKHAPAIVQEKTTKTIMLAEAKRVIGAMVAKTGEVPPGFDWVEPTDVFYPNVDPPALPPATMTTTPQLIPATRTDGGTPDDTESSIQEGDGTEGGRPEGVKVDW